MSFGRAVASGRRVLRAGLMTMGGLTLVGGIGFAVKSYGERKRLEVPAKTVLYVKLNDEAFNEEHQPFAFNNAPGLHEVHKVLRAAKDDPRVVAVVASVTARHATMAQMQELEVTLKELRDSGKLTVAWSENYSTAGYALATCFSRVTVQPTGYISATVPSITGLFFKNLLERVGIKARIEGREEYKSAASSVTQTAFTPADKEQLLAIGQNLTNQIVNTIATQRKLKAEDVRNILCNGPYMGQEALALGLVDGLGFREDAIKTAKDVAEGAKVLGADQYLKAIRKEAVDKDNKSKEIVAVITGRGGVVDRHQGNQNGLSAAKMSHDIRRAAEDDRVRAIVLRLDTPGGTATGGEAIHQAVLAAREKGKVVVVSMGGVCASAGYMVAAASNHIVAQPATITGSIGVVGGKMVVQPKLLEYFGVTKDEIPVNKTLHFESPLHDFDEAGMKKLNTLLDTHYDDFLRKVAAGRGMTVEAVRAKAGGRIYTGAEAATLGLVDTLGGLKDAVTVAKKLADIPQKVPAVRYPSDSPWAHFIKAMRGETYLDEDDSGGGFPPLQALLRAWVLEEVSAVFDAPVQIRMSL